MAHISLSSYKNMRENVKKKADEVMKKAGNLGEIFQLLALNEKVFLQRMIWLPLTFYKRPFYLTQLNSVLLFLFHRRIVVKCVSVYTNNSLKPLE